MVEPLRHRQSKEAATDMFSLQPPRHISNSTNRFVLASADRCRLATRWRSNRSIITEKHRTFGRWLSESPWQLSRFYSSSCTSPSWSRVWRGAEIVCVRFDILSTIETINHLLRAMAEGLPGHIDLLLVVRFERDTRLNL